jgi:DNA-binding FadR family transcriptional regulator
MSDDKMMTMDGVAARELIEPSGAAELREPRLHERAAVMLATDVVSGRLGPGEQFPSADQIVERFGVSRTVAREALQTLSMLGLVRVQHGKRTEVLPAEDWNVLSPVVQEALRRENRLEPVWRDLYEFRRLIEPRAAAWMAERGSDRDLVQLNGLAAEMRTLAEGQVDLSRFMAADQAFHRLIARSGANSVLSAVSRSFWRAVSLLWLESKLDAQQIQEVVQQHQRIAEAITVRDPDAAAKAMEDHLRAASTMDVGHFSQST